MLSQLLAKSMYGLEDSKINKLEPMARWLGRGKHDKAMSDDIVFEISLLPRKLLPRPDSSINTQLTTSVR